MEPTPLPTPFDIVAVPAVPYVPAWWHWALLLLIVFLIALAWQGLLMLDRLRRRRCVLKAYELLRARFREAAARPADSLRAALLEAALLSKRFLSVQEGLDFSSLAPSELEKLGRESTNSELGRVVKSLAELDGLSYTPGGLPAEAGEILLSLEAALERYYRAKLEGIRP